MISKAYSTFFEELDQNNYKEWFHTNKKRYETDIKEPFINLLAELIPTLRKWDDRIIPDEKKAIFRINRDVRFSKDKTPYHILLKAGFSPNGKKSMLPGYYLGIRADTIHVGGGLFKIKAPEIKLVREYIANNLDAFLSIVNAKNFKKQLTELKGEKAKRIDKKYDEVIKRSNLIYNKQFYAMTQLPLSKYYDSKELPKIIIEHFKAIKPLNDFLNEVLIN